MFRLLFIVGLVVGVARVEASQLNVVTSIKPVALLVQEVAGDRAQVTTLLQAGQSPHHFNLSVAARSALSKADLLVWMGPGMEPFLSSIADDVHNLPWEDAEVGREHHDHRDHHHDNEASHVWLGPVAAIDAMGRMAEALSALDPANKDFYFNNVVAASTRLEQWLASVDRLENSAGRQWVVDHDAYQPLALDMGLPAGALGSCRQSGIDPRC